MISLLDLEKLIGKNYKSDEVSQALSEYYFSEANVPKSSLNDIPKNLKKEKSAEADLLIDYADREYYLCPGAGLEIVCYNDVIETIFMMGPGTPSYMHFTGQLLPGISFESCRHDVESALGRPSAAGKGMPDFLFGSGTWCRYDRPLGVFLHFSFHKEIGSLEKITIMNECP